ncbi:MAG: cation diffusion facilitator family transporter [Oscillospiraceae bacterium]|jgi:cation diffusion facilitator family transporter
MAVKSESQRVSLVGAGVNALLSVVKFTCGIAAGSSALISDAVDSSADVVNSLIGFWGIRASEKEADYDHEYGHERIECIASIFLSALMFMSGAYIVYRSIAELVQGSSFEGNYLISAGAALFSLAAKAVLCHFTKSAYLRSGSSALKAAYLNYRNDCFTEVAVVAGLAGAWFGLRWLDGVLSILLGAVIIKSGAEVLKSASDKLSDKACDSDTELMIRNLLLSVEGVKGIDMLKTRQFGSRIYIDAEIRVDGSLTLRESHTIAENAHDLIEHSMSEVKHIMIHVNPD